MTAKDELERVLIICEAGVNHNGSLDRAMELVEAAARAGADVVKFQTFKAEHIVTAAAPKAAYQNRNAPEYASQLEMLKGLELDADAHRALIKHSLQHDIQFLSTPFDCSSVHLLVETLGMKMLKVSSGDLTNAPLLLRMAQMDVDLILSTGMATMDEIEEALGVVAFGYLRGTSPHRAAFRAAWESEAGRAILQRRVSILHCTSDYPAQLDDVNLRVIHALHQHLGLRTGYSDHTQGIAVALAATACGARIIEKHITLDRNLPGPDHRTSLEPMEFAEMVSGIRAIEQALGSSEKKPTAAELSTRKVARKTIVAAKAIGRGEIFTVENLTTKRAGAGMMPVELWDLVGHPATREYTTDEMIEA